MKTLLTLFVLLLASCSRNDADPVESALANPAPVTTTTQIQSCKPEDNKDSLAPLVRLGDLMGIYVDEVELKPFDCVFWPGATLNQLPYFERILLGMNGGQSFRVPGLHEPSPVSTSDPGSHVYVLVDTGETPVATIATVEKTNGIWLVRSFEVPAPCNMALMDGVTVAELPTAPICGP